MDVSTTAPAEGWTDLLASQLSEHWAVQLRPRLDGLSDEEYLFEPVPGSWSIRPAGAGDPTLQVGRSAWRIDFSHPAPDPAPVTTIAWRLAHLVVDVFGERNARYFDGRPFSYDDYDFPATAAGALADLDAGYARWIAGVKALTPCELAAPSGEPDYESASMAALVLHIHREVIHHGAEISLLRDLWAHRDHRAAPPAPPGE